MKSAVRNFFSRKRNKVLVSVIVLLLGGILVAFYTSAPSGPHQPAPIVEVRSQQDRRTKISTNRPVSRFGTHRASKAAYPNEASPCGQGPERDQRSTQSSPRHFSGDEQLPDQIPTVPAFVPAPGRMIIFISAGSSVTPAGPASVQISMEPPPAPRRYSPTDN